MSDNENLVLAHKFSSELKEGDVALVLRADGPPEIHHNVPSLVETGQLVGGPDGNSGGIMLALGLMNILGEDHAALSAAMVRVSGLLEGGTLRLVN